MIAYRWHTYICYGKWYWISFHLRVTLLEVFSVGEEELTIVWVNTDSIQLVPGLSTMQPANQESLHDGPMAGSEALARAANLRGMHWALDKRHNLSDTS